MDYFPINLNIRGRSCIVVGGGRVAERKVYGLLEYGGKITVISPELTPKLQELMTDERIGWIDRPYQTGDLVQAFLVIAATDDPLVQEEIHAEAEENNLLLNVADVPKWCNFILPATVRRGALTVSISTSGKSPALARKLRKKMDKEFGAEYETLLAFLGDLRPVVLALAKPHSENKVLFERLLHRDLSDWLQDGNWRRIREHLRLVVGENVDLSCLVEMENKAKLSGSPV